MSELDEMLNDYIDNALSNDLVNELKQKLEEDEAALKKLKALRVVDESLKSMEVYKAPANFTEKLMNAIAKKSRAVKHSMRKFMISISSILSMILFIIFVVLIVFIGKEEPKTDVTLVVNDLVSKGMNIINNYMNNNLFLIISSSLVLIGMTTIYMLIDTHNTFRKKLNNITN